MEKVPPITTAAGAYTEITRVGGPDSAGEGNVIVIPVEVVNRWAQQFRIYCTGDLDTVERFLDKNELVNPGQTWYLSGIFYMPGRDVTLTIKTWYLVEGKFYNDDQKTKKVTLASGEFSNLGASYRRLP